MNITVIEPGTRTGSDSRRTVAIDPAHTKDTWQTPPAVWAQLQADFGPFALDLTADRSTTLLPGAWLGPGSPVGRDALDGGWHRLGERGYSNPPYGRFVPRLLEVAALEAEHGFTSTILLPMRVTKAFLEIVLERADQVLFCDRRICFWEHGAPRWNAKALAAGRQVPDPAMFDSLLVRFLSTHPPNSFNGFQGAPRIRRAHARPTLHVWHVPPHVG